MVFFCGAGISVPTGLPSFPRLVELLFEKLGIVPGPQREEDDRTGGVRRSPGPS